MNEKAAAAAAAKDLITAANTAKEVVATAVGVASELEAKRQAENDFVAKALETALRDVFGENEKAQRFVDVSRIPLLCKSILDMHKNIDQINDNITWIVRIFIGGVAMALLGLLFVK